MSGWIKIHRKFIDWEWFNKSEAVHLFIYMLLKANHKSGKWQGIDIKRGQFISSLGNISNATGISIQTIRTILKKLEKTNEIELKSTSQYSIVTICKYECYQDEKDEANKPITNNQQASNKQLTTNKNEKKEKNEKEVILDTWINYRKAAKKTLTEQSIKSILSKMDNYTNDQCINVINKSIEQGWQGLFWDSVKSNETEYNGEDLLYKNVMQQIQKLKK
jgi:DNA-binding transcriptional MerR regulator